MKWRQGPTCGNQCMEEQVKADQTYVTGLTLIDCLREDVELEPGELNMEMRDRDVWRQTVGASRMSE